jgi:hypothetical protein
MGKSPAMTKAANVANPLREAFASEGRAPVTTERIESTLLVPIENPSANRFAVPSTMIAVVDIAAPVTLAITTRS